MTTRRRHDCTKEDMACSGEAWGGPTAHTGRGDTEEGTGPPNLDVTQGRRYGAECAGVAQAL